MAMLRWMQVRTMRREWKRVVDFEATVARMLSMIRDRLLAVPDRMQELSPGQREALRREIASALEDCSHAEL
jgi:hypothetical protein